MNVREWIQSLVERHPDKPVAGIGRALGRDKSVGSKILNGTRQVRADEIPVIADYFGEQPPPSLMVPRAVPPPGVRAIPIKGEVQAGVWTDVWEHDDGEAEFVSLPVSSRYAHFPVFALRVIGPSMNLLYPDGSIIVCVRYSDLGRLPKPSERVVCVRRNKAGLYEATVKELVIDDKGHARLLPRSNHPEHQQSYRLPKLDPHVRAFIDDGELPQIAAADDAWMDDGETEDIEVIARVVGSYRDED